MVEAVLFDSGGVLMGPIGGRWNPRADFEEHLLKHHPGLDDEAIVEAIAVGDTWMSAQGSTPEYRDYYRQILGALDLDTGDVAIDALLPEAPGSRFVEMFPDVPETLVALKRRGIRLAVVSDAWTGLQALHDLIGIPSQDFEMYAISQEIGCVKPDERMYRHASEALGLAPQACLFVDDCGDLVAAAIRYGYHGVALRRDGEPPPEDVPWITTLPEILHLV
ncbi:MAG TPA: HAD-IA family hydrolase [Gaiellaceae bacterium]|nr:HAD-IA family hydrolase [Gaiellaceae bacterium]